MKQVFLVKDSKFNIIGEIDFDKRPSNEEIIKKIKEKYPNKGVYFTLKK